MLRSRLTRRFAARMSGGAASAAVLAAAVFASATALAETLIIKSEPPGASVFLDDEQTPRARTPCALTDVARGGHKIRVTLPGYRDKVRVVFLSAGKSKTVEFQFATQEHGPSEPAPKPPAPEPRPKPAFERRSDAPKPPRTVEASCPFCRGSGLVKEVGCSKCRATGYFRGDECGKCSGSGRGAYSCPYCKGQGRLAAGGRQGKCRACAGKGSPPCGGCGGKGAVPRPNPEAAGYPTEECAACDGKGCVQKAKCIVCAGRGKIGVGTARQGVQVGGGGQRVGPIQGRYRDNDYRMVDCTSCDGKGEGPPVCRRCFGRGFSGSGKRLRPCNFCWGTGHAWIPCGACGGRGWLRGK